MMKIKKILCLVLAAALTLSVCVSFAGCGETAAPVEETQAPAQTVSYGVTVQSMGGMALGGTDVYVYADNTLGDLKAYGQTNEDGQAAFTLPESDDYAIVLSSMPDGYAPEAFYSFSGTNTTIKVESRLVKGESLSSATLGLGDVMYDFSVVTPAGETVTLSDMLQEKEMVLLNFWYTTCTWCVTEFPFMEEAYQTYGDKVGIIALNPMGESDGAIANFQESMGLTFPLAACQMAWANTFGISGYPTSIAVDRYGVICMIEAGGITSLRPFINMFDHFTGDDYTQMICYNGLSDLVVEVKPTYTMESSEQISEAINVGQIDVTYHPEEEDENAELYWPFILTEKNGERCLKASNQEIDGSYAILYADVYLQPNQAFGFDYLASSELNRDMMYVIVNDDDIFQISGAAGEGEEEQWNACYPCVATEAGYYEVALCYLKDESDAVGDDTIYIKNARVVDVSEVDTVTYLPREAATTEDGFDYQYVDVVLSAKDGYYHVGTEDGPLLLANLMNYSQFSEEQSVFEMVIDGDVLHNGVSLYEQIVDFCSYASNSALSGFCTVNEELAELLKVVADQYGFDGTEDEWLKMCRYYQVYGAEGVQLTDPIQGLSTFSAYKALLGTDVETNYFYYDRAIMPRGMFAEFVPATSGVYRITSKCDSMEGVEGWIFNEDKEILLTYAQDERMYGDSENCSMVLYMEAGKPYYINIAFWDYYETGYIYYDIEFEGSSLNLFRLCSPGFFTYDTNATGDAMYHIISGGIKSVLKEDGYYYEDLGKDEAGNQLYGSKIYADFTGITSLFDTPIASAYQTDANGQKVKIEGMIDKGGFDFSKTEDDLYILSFMEKHDNDVDATDAYLKELWDESYEEYAEVFQLEDVYKGIYHGSGEDLTEEIRAYEAKIENAPADRAGCVAVDERLAEILQLLMDKYTFDNVDASWMKLCYYYDYLGANR